MSIIGKLFNPKKLVESVVSGVDKAILTNEERIDYMKEMLKLYEPYKIAQRYISLVVAIPFMLMFVVGCTLWVCLQLKGKDPKAVYDLWHYMDEVVGTEFKLIIGFYFAGGVLEGTVNKLSKLRKQKGE